MTKTLKKVIASLVVFIVLFSTSLSVSSNINVLELNASSEPIIVTSNDTSNTTTETLNYTTSNNLTYTGLELTWFESIIISIQEFIRNLFH